MAPAVLEGLLQWRNITDLDYRKGRSRRPGGPSLSPADAERISEVNRLDAALYDYGHTMGMLDWLIATAVPLLRAQNLQPLTCANSNRNFPKR